MLTEAGGGEEPLRAVEEVNVNDDAILSFPALHTVCINTSMATI